jgi:hypothetical protein
MIERLCVLFMGDDVKRRSRRISRYNIELERNTEKVGKLIVRKLIYRMMRLPVDFSTGVAPVRIKQNVIMWPAVQLRNLKQCIEIMTL